MEVYIGKPEIANFSVSIGDNFTDLFDTKNLTILRNVYCMIKRDELQKHFLEVSDSIAYVELHTSSVQHDAAL